MHIYRGGAAAPWAQHLYIISFFLPHGRCMTGADPDPEDGKTLRTLGKGDYFGERAVIFKELRRHGGECRSPPAPGFRITL